MLRDIIIEKIKSDGPIAFKDFMDTALYHPGLGYYTSANNRIGKSGDYFTSPTLTWIFGHMIARQLEEMWLLMDKERFAVVEYGSGTGALCKDILSYLENNTELYDHLDYFIIEKNETRYNNVPATVNKKVQRINSIQEVMPLTGCVLSNELVDNFPVHKVIMEEELMEVFVGLDPAGQEFVELHKPAAPLLREYLDSLNIILPKGFYTEINLSAAEWIKEISNVLCKGFVLTIDYGSSSGELYNAPKKNGTLHCYNKHTVNHDFYKDIGMQDITAYVNFSALHHFGMQTGLDLCGYSNQSRFLHSLGLAGYVKELEQSGQLTGLTMEEKTFLINTILLSMGQTFKVLIQQKGLQKAALCGMQFPAGIL